MFCPKCGKQIDTSEKVCPYCGAQNGYYTAKTSQEPLKESHRTDADLWFDDGKISASVAPAKKSKSLTLGTLAVIFAVLGGWIGFILALAGFAYYKDNPAGKKLCTAAAVIFLIWFFIYFVIVIALM